MENLQSRRIFLKTTATSAMGLLALHQLGCSSCSIKDLKNCSIGLQLYTVRDTMAKDVPGTLAQLAYLGYKELELAGFSDGKFYGYSPKDFKKMVEDPGMKVISSHTQVEARGITINNAKLMADAHAELGVEYCVQPWIEEKDRTIDSYKRMIADWNKVAEIMKDTGIQFAYHNHNFEFEPKEGLVPYYDIFMQEMDAELITMELDLFWATKAGQDPMKMFRNYPGRFQLLHVKDMYTRQEPFFEVIKDDISPVGEGIINFKEIIAAKELSGMKHFFVEDDNQGKGKPFDGLKQSIDNLNNKIL